MRRQGLTLRCLALGTALVPGAAASELPRPPVERVQADVARLAGPEWQGRRAGTEGAERAAEWIAAEFRRIGLAPGGADGSYFQPFTFLDGINLGPGSRLSAPGGRPWKAEEDFRPLVVSAAGTATGEVAFAGYGIVAKGLDYDDYAGLDVGGRIVLMLRFGPEGDTPHSKWAPFTTLRQKVSTARERGARAVLVVTGPRTASASDDLAPLRSEPALTDAGIPALSVKRAVVEALLAGSGASLDALQGRIDETLKPAPLLLAGVRAELTADVTPRHSATRNVIGVLRGDGAGREAVLIGAHYDHLGAGPARGSLDPSPDGKVHPGADDNASGVAGLLELARRLAGRPTPPARDLVFVAFGAEEMGTLGASHFVKNPTVPLSSVVAMVNMDMIGRLREGALDLHGVGTSPVFRGLLDEANRSARLNLRLRDGGFGPSDHSAFYAAGKPVLFVFTGTHEDYHRTTDTAEKVSAAGILRVLDLVEGVVWGLASARTPVPFVRVAAEREQTPASGRGFGVWVGGVPDYGEEGPGVRFSGVTPGSPAEKAGIRAGDVLVRFGDKEVRHIYDYTSALGDRRPGDTVAVVVRRDGRELTLEVTLGSRPSAGR